MNKINIAIAERNPLMLSGIITYLSNYQEFYDVINYHRNVDEMMKNCISNKNIDILLLGEFPELLGGIELVRWVSSKKIKAKKLAYFDKSPYLSGKTILDAGADGIVWKASAPESLNKAIRYLKNDINYNDDEMSDAELKIRRPSSQNILTSREREILQYIADCKTNKEIARSLNLSNKTIETHRLNLMKKLDAHSGVELLRTALKMGVCYI